MLNILFFLKSIKSLEQEEGQKMQGQVFPVKLLSKHGMFMVLTYVP